MNGVFDRVNEFHIFRGGKSQLGGAGGCFQEGCSEVAAIFDSDRAISSPLSYLEALMVEGMSRSVDF
jgi:hypothetical protein